MIVVIDPNGKVRIVPTLNDCPSYEHVLYEAKVEGVTYVVIVRAWNSKQNLVRGPYGTAIQAAVIKSEYLESEYYTEICAMYQ